jgi:hypothetical protein
MVHRDLQALKVSYRVIGMAGLQLTPWKQLPEGVDSYNPVPDRDEFTGRSDTLARGPEPAYEPAPTRTTLTPDPRDLLRAMRPGAVLRKPGKDWSSWTLHGLAAIRTRSPNGRLPVHQGHVKRYRCRALDRYRPRSRRAQAAICGR